MPTDTIAGMFLTFAGFNNAPWRWNRWHEVTGYEGEPWAEGSTQTVWSAGVATQVRTFVENYLSIPAEDVDGRRHYVSNSASSKAKKILGVAPASDDEPETAASTASASTATASTAASSASASTASTSTAAPKKSKKGKGKKKARKLKALDHTADNAGRSAFINWITKGMKQWGIQKLVDEIMADMNRDAYTAMAVYEGEWPSMTDFGVTDTFSRIADSLFGEEAYILGNLRPPVKKFLDTYMVHTWRRMKGKVTRQKATLETTRKELTSDWTEFSRVGAVIKPADIRKYIAKVKAHLDLVAKFKDDASLDELEAIRTQLETMLAVATGEADELNKLPKPLRDALALLATEDRINLVTLELHQLVTGNDEPPPELDFAALPEDGWKEGVEEYANTTVDDLWAMFGLSATKAIPGFNTKQDPTGSINPWTPEGEAFLTTDEAIPLEPRWHQLVGLVKTMDQMVAGKPLLVMDEVGLGKTLQSIAAIAMRLYFRKYFAEHKRFPGKWHDQKHPTGPEGNLPDGPNIIICPASLEDQWKTEMRRFLRSGEVDILPYLGYHERRTKWWSNFYTKSKHTEERRIIIGSIDAIKSDGNAMLSTGARRHGDAQPRVAVNTSTSVYGRRYGVMIWDEAHRVRTLGNLFTAARELRKLAGCCVALTATPVLTQVSDLWYLGCFLGIPKLDGPEHDAVLKTLMSNMRAATKADRNEAKETGIDKKVVSRIAHGQGFKVSGSTRFQTEIVDAMKDIRQRYDGFVLRRTLKSKRFDGQPISGIVPFVEHPILLTLPKWEMENLDLIARKEEEDEAARAAAKAKENKSYVQGQNFYLSIRRALIHPGCNDEFHFQMPGTLDEWLANTSAKMVAMIRILEHHLEEDGAVPLTVESTPQMWTPGEQPSAVQLDDGATASTSADPAPAPDSAAPAADSDTRAPAQVLDDPLAEVNTGADLDEQQENDDDDPIKDAPEVSSDEEGPSPASTAPDIKHARDYANLNNLVPESDRANDPRTPGSAPDKICLFTSFPQLLPFILAVLDFFGIQYMVITGAVAKAKRTKILREFQRSGRNGPRVLVMSKVGLVGLNLAFMNVMIIVDTLWSAQEDAQLIGRIWRHPQMKLVHIYRLIGMDSPDVFLNNISFDKSFMHRAFLNMSPAIKRVFRRSGDDALPIEIPSDESDDDIEEITITRPEPKPKTPRRRAPPKPRAKKVVSVEEIESESSSEDEAPPANAADPIEEDPAPRSQKGKGKAPVDDIEDEEPAPRSQKGKGKAVAFVEIDDPAPRAPKPKAKPLPKPAVSAPPAVPATPAVPAMPADPAVPAAVAPPAVPAVPAVDDIEMDEGYKSSSPLSDIDMSQLSLAHGNAAAGSSTAAAGSSTANAGDKRRHSDEMGRETPAEGGPEVSAAGRPVRKTAVPDRGTPKAVSAPAKPAGGRGRGRGVGNLRV